MSSLGGKIIEGTVEILKPTRPVEVVIAVAELVLLVCTVVRDVRGGRL